MPSRQSRGAAVLTTVLVALGVVTAIGAPPAAARSGRLTAIVGMGDSYVSGEGAGRYLSGTDRPGNFCHRSTLAGIARTAIPGVRARINLACSGATTDHVRLGGRTRYGERPQAEQLRDVARRYRVRLILLTVGAGDVGWGNLAWNCIAAYHRLGPRCQDVWAIQFGERLAAATPGIARALADVRAVMRQAGYADRAYKLVLQSYSSPVTEDMRYKGWTRSVEGCPIRADDARWAREYVVPRLTATMATVAGAGNARFLDLGPALRGREVCARGIIHRQEWVHGVTIDLTQLRNGIGPNLVQESFHPNARGHAEFGRCLTAFVAQRSTAARCVRRADGTLSPEPVRLSTLRRAPPPMTFPRMPEPATPRA